MKNLIRTMMLVLCLSFLGSTAYAQTNKQRLSREQLAQAQAKTIARQLAFDEKTTKQFVEVYCQCQKEIWALGPRKQRRSNADTQEDTERFLDGMFERSQSILDIRKKYYEKYRKFLTPKQIKRVYESEKQMMNRLRKRRMSRIKR